MSVTLALYKRKKPIPEEKVKRVELLSELLLKYNKVVIVDIHEVPASLLKKARMAVKELGGYPIVVKNRLLEKAIERVADRKPDAKLLRKYLDGMRMLVFTNDDVIKIARTLDEHKESAPPKPGKRAPEDIVVKKGGTGIKPGPAMTDLRVAGLPIRIIDGELFVMKDTVLVKKGQRLSPQVVKVMQILDISPFVVGPKVVGIIDEGVEIPTDVALKPVEEYAKMFEDAIRTAHGVAVHAAIPVPGVIPDLLLRGFREAFELAVAAGIPTPETLEHLIIRAVSTAFSVAREIHQRSPDALPVDLRELVSASATAEAEEEKKEEEAERKEEEKKEEEGAGEFVGLAGLFG